MVASHEVQTSTLVEQSLIGETIGRFEVKRLLGEGGAGAVYLAEHSVIHTRVAIKVLTGAAYNPDMFARFVREARATNTIVSPHVPRYYDFGQLPDGRPYAVMEYLEGETLASYLAQRGPLTISETVDLLRQLADGMCAAHKVGVIHRDLKPDNIFLVPKPSGGLHLVILDFGIAKLLGPRDSEVGATHAGLFIGTPQYCAPEQIAGTPVTAATDVYALGVIAFELLAGHRPFDGNGIEPLGAKLGSDAPSLADHCSSLPRTVIVDVATMLARLPAARIATMNEALARIVAWARMATPDTPTLSATPLPTSIRVEVPAPRRWRYSVLVAALAGLVGVAIGWGAHGRAPLRQAEALPATAVFPPPSAAKPIAPAPIAPAAAPIAPAPVPVPAPAPPPEVVTTKPAPAATPAPVSRNRPKPRTNRNEPDLIVADPFE